MEVYSAPYLFPVHASLQDSDENLEKLKELYKEYPNKKLGTYGSFLLVEFTVTEKETYIVAIDNQEIVYLAHTHTDKLLQLSEDKVTQLEVWRKADIPGVSGLARVIVFKILLPRYSFLVSAESQTDSGRLLWIDLLERAANLGYKVGITIDNYQVGWQEPDTYKDWLSVIGNEAWLKENKQYPKRFVISKKV